MSAVKFLVTPPGPGRTRPRSEHQALRGAQGSARCPGGLWGLLKLHSMYLQKLHQALIDYVDLRGNPQREFQRQSTLNSPFRQSAHLINRSECTLRYHDTGVRADRTLTIQGCEPEVTCH